MRKYEIELKKIEYGYVTIKANSEEEAIKEYKENGGKEVFFSDNQATIKIEQVIEVE